MACAVCTGFGGVLACMACGDVRGGSREQQEESQNLFMRVKASLVHCGGGFDALDTAPSCPGCPDCDGKVLGEHGPNWPNLSSPGEHQKVQSRGETAPTTWERLLGDES